VIVVDDLVEEFGVGRTITEVVFRIESLLRKRRHLHTIDRMSQRISTSLD
jgi:hypothetical protein